MNGLKASIGCVKIDEVTLKKPMEEVSDHFDTFIARQFKLNLAFTSFNRAKQSFDILTATAFDASSKQLKSTMRATNAQHDK